jgi:hypothetical protein
MISRVPDTGTHMRYTIKSAGIGSSFHRQRCTGPNDTGGDHAVREVRAKMVPFSDLAFRSGLSVVDAERGLQLRGVLREIEQSADRLGGTQDEVLRIVEHEPEHTEKWGN